MSPHNKRWKKFLKVLQNHKNIFYLRHGEDMRICTYPNNLYHSFLIYCMETSCLDAIHVDYYKYTWRDHTKDQIELVFYEGDRRFENTIRSN